MATTLSDARLSLASGLQLSDWLNLIGLIIGVVPVLGTGIALGRRLQQTSPRIALHEFALLIRRPLHALLIVVILGSTIYLIIKPPSRFPISLALLIPVMATLLLLASFFLAQSRRLSDAVILNEMSRMSKAARSRPDGVLAAIRFDIDRLKAITNHYPTVAERIRNVVDTVIREEVAKQRSSGKDIVAHGITGEDETVVIAAGMDVEQAAEFADKIRHVVREEVKRIRYYSDAVNVVADGMQQPANSSQGQGGIGTVSAGVAADRGRPDILFSEISAAVKDAKTRGRDKTVVYRPGVAPEVRG